MLRLSLPGKNSTLLLSISMGDYYWLVSLLQMHGHFFCSLIAQLKGFFIQPPLLPTINGNGFEGL
jgi:hypothetical protein